MCSIFLCQGDVVSDRRNRRTIGSDGTTSLQPGPTLSQLHHSYVHRQAKLPHHA